MKKVKGIALTIVGLAIFCLLIVSVLVLVNKKRDSDIVEMNKRLELTTVEVTTTLSKLEEESISSEESSAEEHLIDIPLDSKSALSSYKDIVINSALESEDRLNSCMNAIVTLYENSIILEKDIVFVDMISISTDVDAEVINYTIIKESGPYFDYVLLSNDASESWKSYFKNKGIAFQFAANINEFQ